MMNDFETDEALESVAIIGMAGRFPGAEDADEFWRNLCAGRSAVSFFTDEELLAAGEDPALLKHPGYVRAGAVLKDIAMFDAPFFGFSPREAALTDPQHRLFLECAWEALEHGGYDPGTYDGKIGVFAGAGMNAYLQKNLISNPDLVRSADVYQIAIGNDKDFIPTRVSYKLDLRGPSVNISTACSSSLVAVHFACQNLLGYQCDMALAGGVTLQIPQKRGYVYQEGGILSPDGQCRAFDADARGTVAGSGAGIVLLKRLEDALADGDCIHALIRGSAINNDGSLKVGYTAPSVEGQAEVIAEAQAVAGIDPETITYVETHGTGTSLGDPIEIAALTRAFRVRTRKKGFCAIGSAKPNVGHLDTAAGVTGLIKAALALRHGKIPPSLNFEQPNPEIDFASSPFYVNTALSDWNGEGTSPRRAGISSFGLGGTNAHAVLEEAPPLPSAPEDRRSGRPWHLFVLSAKTRPALDAATENLAAHLKAHPELNRADAAYTLQVGRKAFYYRQIVLLPDAGGTSGAEGEDALSPKRVLTNFDAPAERPVVFMFPGQGAQYVNMGRELYTAEPVFREAVDRCSEVLRLHMGSDLRSVLYPAEDQTQAAARRINRTAVAQPALFVTEYALAQLWISWGVRPQAMIGHSIGEYVAACLAGVFSLEEALALVAARGKMMQELPPGDMLAVPLAEAEIRPLLTDGLSLAAVNAPALCVVSGRRDAVESLRKKLRGNGTECRPLHTSHAFHSELTDPILKPFAEKVRAIELKPPRIPYISNLTGTWITPEMATDPGYWADHLRQTVRFADGLGELMSGPDRIFLEVGPGRTLHTFALAHPDRLPEHLMVTSVRHPLEDEPDSAFILTALGRLWLSGLRVDWHSFHAHERRFRVPLPTYPFERQRYWIDPPAAGSSPTRPETGKKPDMADWFYAPSWKRSPGPDPGPASRSPENWLVFCDNCGLGERLTKRLEASGDHVTTVRIGPAFAKQSDREYSLSPGEEDGYDALLTELRGQNRVPRRILHLWNVTPDNGPLSADSYRSAQDSGLYSLLSLARAIGKQDLNDPLKIGVISTGIHAVTGGESLRPEKATVLGPVKIIPTEYPNITCCNMDVILPGSGSPQAGQLADQLLAELLAETNEPVVAFRGPYRWVQTVEQIRLSASADGVPARLREKGVYLITGGLGGIGLALAEYLGRTLKARLILTGRSAVPGRDEWDGWLAAHDEADRTSGKIRKLREMEASGAEVLVFGADVSDPEVMEAVVAQARKRFGHINGVIHSAGLADYAGVIQRRSKEMTEEVLAPKTLGILVLDDILKEDRPDFILLCSSLGNVLYKSKFGQVAYNAANEFLDAFAEYRSSQTGTFTVSVNWSDWQEVGMSVEAAKQWSAFEKELLRNGLLPSEGAEVFCRTIAGALPRVAVSTRDLPFLMEHGTEMLTENLVKSDTAQPFQGRPELGNAYAAPENRTQQLLADIWQELLGVDQVGIYDNFFELGGHSLLAVQLVSRVNEVCDVKLSLNSLFNHPTVAELAENVTG